LRSWHSKNLLRHPLSVPVLLVAVILAVYYPALLSGIHPIDDPGIIAFFSNSLSLSSILMPGNSFYYRPVVELSYFIDNWLWGMAPGVMHMENILVHCANTLLVYLLARRISSDNETPLIPLVAALLFALHPVNVEAVAWIAGRTDPLLALFILSASYFWLKWLEKPRWQVMSAAMLTFTVALLTKESALAFGAVAVLLALTWPGEATGRQRLKALSFMIVPVLLLLILVLLFRGGKSGLHIFLSTADLKVAQSTWEALVAFGFYFKKLIFPFPLNFAVNTLHPLYGLLGVAIFPVLWLVFRRYRLPGIFFISAVLFILPAILVAVKHVAWTPFAERYLYLSTSFLALGLVGICEAWQRKYPAVLMSSIVLLLCGSALGSFQRNLLWKDPLSFFQDAVAKSPEFGSVYYSLGGVLMQKGEIDRAATAFATADRLNQRASMRYPIKENIMGIMLAKGEYLEARTYFFQICGEKKAAPVQFLELLYIADSKRLESIAKEEKALLANDLLETLGLLYLKKPDPFWLYQSGKMALVIGNSKSAADFFRRAFIAAPVDAHYKDAAKTYFLRLEAEK
jgi:protein O-mannosyl-transferase